MDFNLMAFLINLLELCPEFNIQKYIQTCLQFGKGRMYDEQNVIYECT